MRRTLKIATQLDLPREFGELGLRPLKGRTVPGARSSEKREWWCLRRYVFSLSAADKIEFPIRIEKSDRPDFRCEFAARSLGIEVTTATTPEDEAAMTKQERADLSALVGFHGGRFPRGAGNPGVAWRGDVLQV